MLRCGSQRRKPSNLGATGSAGDPAYSVCRGVARLKQLCLRFRSLASKRGILVRLSARIEDHFGDAQAIVLVDLLEIW